LSELIYDRIKYNLATLKMSKTLEIMDNYLEHATKDEASALKILDHIIAQEADSKRLKSSNIRIKMASFPYRKTAG